MWFMLCFYFLLLISFLSSKCIKAFSLNQSTSRTTVNIQVFKMCQSI